MKILNKNNLKYLYWLVLFAILAFFHSSHTLNSDEGVILDGAWSLINGREIYTEAIHYITPGSFYLLFLVWKIFGASFLSAKLLSIFILFISAIGIKKISDLFHSGKMNYLAPLIFIFSSFSWPIINHNTFNLCCIIWALFFFIKGIERYSLKLLASSGLLSGIGIMFLQHKSGLLLIWSIIFLLILYRIEKNNKIIKAGAVFILASIIPCLFLLKWPIATLFNYLFLAIAKNYRVYNPVPPYLFGLVSIFVFLGIWIIKEKKNKKIYFLVSTQILLLSLAWLQRPDFYHIFLILFPSYSLLPLVIIELNKKTKAIKVLYSSILATILLVTLIVNVSYLIIFPPLTNDAKPIVQAINQLCGDSEYIYAGPFLPGLYFETRKKNPSAYYVLTINSEDALSGRDNTMIQQYREVEKDLQRTRPECAIVNLKMMEKFNYEKDNPVDNFIEENYLAKENFGDAILYKIKE